MKKWLVCCLLFCYINLGYAENPTLRVAVSGFSPPFALQTTPHNFSGFDIATMEYVCQSIQHRCEYIPVEFGKLIETVVSGEADVAIGGLVITIERSRKVYFSIPYMVSKVQVITNQDNPVPTPFTLENLSGERVGTLEGGALPGMIAFKKNKRPDFIEFKHDADIIHALQNKQVNFVILSTAKATYWNRITAGAFKKVGSSFPVGFGFSIAVNPKKRDLLKEIDLALFNYQSSDEYKQNYDLYFKNNF